MLLPFRTLSEDNAFHRLIIFLLALISNLRSVITILLAYYCIVLLVLLATYIVFLSHTTDKKIIESIRDCTEKLFVVFILRQKKKPTGAWTFYIEYFQNV